jgi:signal transduction histidine kinase
LSEIALESIVKSLISHAYVHGGPDVSVEVDFGTVPVQGEMLKIIITDSGVGIPEEE